MSRPLHVVVVGLCAAGVLAAPGLESFAQSPKTAPAKKPAAVRPVEANDQDVEAPQPKARTKPAAGQPQGGNRGAAPQSPGADQRPAVPEVRPFLRVQNPDPALEKILKDWETRSAKFNRLKGPITRIKYDHVFGVESWGEVKFVYEAPDKGYYELSGKKPPEPKPGAKIWRKTNGEPYDRKPADSEKWVCDGIYVTKINDEANTYERAEIPEDQRGQNIIDGPLPFLFGMKAQQAKARYFLELKEANSRFPDDYQIRVVPKEKRDSDLWSEATLILSSKTFLPQAVTLMHPGGGQTVHIFGQIEINSSGIFQRDPFRPNLKGYQQVNNEAAQLPDGATPPANGMVPRAGAATAPRNETPAAPARPSTAAAQKKTATQKK